MKKIYVHVVYVKMKHLNIVVQGAVCYRSDVVERDIVILY